MFYRRDAANHAELTGFTRPTSFWVLGPRPLWATTLYFPVVTLEGLAQIYTIWVDEIGQQSQRPALLTYPCRHGMTQQQAA